jgi:hypothetical protein
MQLLPRSRSRSQSPPSSERSLQPKAQGIKFLRTFSTRPLSASNADAFTTPPHTAARVLRGWFGSPPSPNSSGAEEQEEHKWGYLDEGKEWEGFLREVEDEGGFNVPPPKSPIFLRRVGGAETDERRSSSKRRSDLKSNDWDAAMLAHARSLGCSCPSSPSDFGSNSSVESLASGSSGSSSTHAPSMSVFSPSIRVASYYRPTRCRPSSHTGGGKETRRSVASEDFVARYFAGGGPKEGSMLEGFRQGPKPMGMEGRRRDEAQSPGQQNTLQLEVDAHPTRTTEDLQPAEPTFSSFAPVSRTTLTVSCLGTGAKLQSLRDASCPSSPPTSPPPRAHSPTSHRTFRPSPLGPRNLPSIDSEDNKRCEDPSTDPETLRVWKSKRRRNTMDGSTTIWEMAMRNHRESIMKSAVVEVCYDGGKSN